MQDASVAHAMATNCELSLARVLDEASSMGGTNLPLPSFLLLPQQQQQQHQHRLLPFVAVACKHIKLNYCRWAQRLAAVSFASTQQRPLFPPPLCLSFSLVVVLVRLVVFVCDAGGQRQAGAASKRSFKCALNSSQVACTHTHKQEPLGAPVSMLQNFLAAATRFIRHATAYT